MVQSLLAVTQLEVCVTTRRLRLPVHHRNSRQGGTRTLTTIKSVDFKSTMATITSLVDVGHRGIEPLGMLQAGCVYSALNLH